MLRNIVKVNLTKTIISCAQRNISTTSRLRDIFKVQSEDDFKTRVVEASNKEIIVVDFMATWCNPCKVLTPRIESVVSEFKGKVSLAKVKKMHTKVQDPVNYLHFIFHCRLI
jgi:thioredoxin 1